MILKLIKKSLPIECELLAKEDSDMPPSKQAFSKARYKIKSEGFKAMMLSGVQNFYEPDSSYGSWRGYRLIAIDGSTIKLPDSSSVIEKFPKLKANHNGESDYPLARMSLCIDLCTSIIVNAKLDSLATGEREMAESQIEEITELFKKLGQEKIVYIYDRGYPSTDFMETHKKLDVDFVMRMQRGGYKKIWERVDAGEKDFEIDAINKETKTSIRIRIIAITLSTGITEVLATTLFDKNAFSIDDLNKLYALRWQIEESYKKLKVASEIENFSGNNIEAIFQEFWAHMVISNIISAYMSDEQGCINIDKLPSHRLNFSLIFGAMREKVLPMLLGELSAESFDKFFKRVASRAKVKLRPGRSYSREKVGRPKRHRIFSRVC
jgi:hypothetical protein